MVGGKVRARWPQHFLRPSEHFCSHHNVLLLHGGCDGPGVSKVHLVEEVPDYLSNGAVRVDHESPVPAILHGVRLSSYLHDLDRFARLAIPRTVLGLLQSEVRGKIEVLVEAAECAKRLVDRHVYADPRGQVDVAAKQRLVVRDDLQQGIQQLLQQRDEQRLRCQQQHGEEARLGRSPPCVL